MGPAARGALWPRRRVVLEHLPGLDDEIRKRLRLSSDVGESDQFVQSHVSEEEAVAPHVAAAVLEPTPVEALQPALFMRRLMLGEDHTGPENDLPPLVLRTPRGVASSVPLKP